MRFGFRRPSLAKRIAARTSWKRAVRHRLRLKAPRGMGWFTQPKKAAYNRVYNRTSFSLDRLFRTGRRRSSEGGGSGGEGRARGGTAGGCGCLILLALAIWIVAALSR